MKKAKQEKKEKKKRGKKEEDEKKKQKQQRVKELMVHAAEKQKQKNGCEDGKGCRLLGTSTTTVACFFFPHYLPPDFLDLSLVSLNPTFHLPSLAL